MAKVKRKVKDSVFTALFRDPKNQLALYHSLHPEETHVTEKDLKLVTLENILATGQYNDLGLQVGNRLILLIEAQSTYSPNLPVRMLMYLADTYKNYVEENKINLYSTKPQKFPVPELYVVYSGKRQNVPPAFRLSDLWDGAGDVEIAVRVLRRQETEGILDEYLRFCEIVDAQRVLYGLSQKAIEETIRICLEENVLVPFWEVQKKEVVDVMYELYNQEQITEYMLHEARQEAQEEYRAEGRAEGLFEAVQALIDSTGWSAQQAMAALKVPEADHQKYLERLAN